jgi:alpha-mannosidase
MERALVEIAGAIDLGDWDKNEMALVVYNPAALKRDDVVRLNLDIPKEWNATGFEIVDEKGNKVATQQISVDPDRFHYIQTPNEVQTLLYSQRYDLLAEFKDLPQMGYKTYKVKPLTGEIFPDMPETMVTGPASMENEHLIVKVNSNGTVYVKDKKSNVEFDNLGYFRDLGDNGDPWWHKPPTKQEIYTSLNESAKVTAVSDGKLEASFRVELNWALPEDNTIDGSARSPHKKNLRIVNTVTLRKGQKWVEIATDIDNCIKNHWLQVALPTGLDTDTVSAQSHFDVIERPTAESPNIVYASEFDAESPLDDFIDISDGKKGLGFIGEGLKAYIPLRDNDNTVAVSLIRTMPLRLGWAKPLDHSSYEQDNQMLGKCSYRYAFVPHKGNWQDASMWHKAQQFNLFPQVGQIGPSKHGTEPMSKSFLDIDPAETLHVSAVKRSEDGTGWVVRLFNPTDKVVKATVKLNNGQSSPSFKPSPVERVKSEFALPGPAEQTWKNVELTNLEERPLEQLETDGKGAVKVNITKKKIVTIKFTPAS